MHSKSNSIFAWFSVGLELQNMYKFLNYACKVVTIDTTTTTATTTVKVRNSTSVDQQNIIITTAVLKDTIQKG